MDNNEKKGWVTLALVWLDNKPWAFFLGLCCFMGGWGWLKFIKQVEKTELLMEKRIQDQKDMRAEQKELDRQKSDLIYNQSTTIKLQQEIIERPAK